MSADELRGPVTVFEHTLEPATGKAVPVRRGQVLRLEQVDGGQCADFNVFNLHDYKEHFDAGRTRRMHGNYPTQGHHLWSAPPRDRPLMTIIADTFGRNDVSFQRCSAFLYEYDFGVETHTNCQDIQAEAQREYGLTPDDVHDSFNIFMAVDVTADGEIYIDRNSAQPGDYIELLAQVDVLAVPNVCGSDLYRTSNFSLKPLRLAVRESQDKETHQWLLPPRQYATQRDVTSFRQKRIKADRELVRDVHYVPEWVNYPIKHRSIPVTFTPPEYEMIAALRASGAFGSDDESIVRDAFLSWWTVARREALAASRADRTRS